MTLYLGLYQNLMDLSLWQTVSRIHIIPWSGLYRIRWRMFPITSCFFHGFHFCRRFMQNAIYRGQQPISAWYWTTTDLWFIEYAWIYFHLLGPLEIGSSPLIWKHNFSLFNLRGEFVCAGFSKQIWAGFTELLLLSSYNIKSLIIFFDIWTSDVF